VLKLDPGDPDALFFLAAIELRAGRAQAAIPLLQQLLKRAPGYPQGKETLELARRQTAPPHAGSAHLRLLRVKDRAQAEAAARRAAAGEDFAALARSLSNDPSSVRGGDLGIVVLAELAEPLRTAAAGLGPGQLSPVLETPVGYIVLKRER